MKTFYSVNYIDFGMSTPRNEWFDNLKEAKAFADRIERNDGVVVHNFKDAEKIERIEEMIDFRKRSEK